MCGIAGWAGPDAGLETLREMTGAIRHRGPDGAGEEIIALGDGRSVGLGHRRLSIIDLATGGQPMDSHDGRYRIVFNGEIYNYIELRQELVARGARFLTHSDTEVILEAWRAWGTGCLTRFRGMFAFALHDMRDRTLALARDPFGKKPLFIARSGLGGGEGLIFASEIQALLKHPGISPELDEAALHDFLEWRYVPGPQTFFRGIEKLPPGSVLTWKNGHVTTERYWLPPEESAAGRAEAPEDAIARFIEIFDEAVRLRLRADVPVGAFLSGGLDSTAIVATLAHQGVPDIRTFSVGFRGDPASELRHAEETAKIIGTTHTSLELETDDLFDWLPQLSRHRGAPVTETADLPIYLMSVEAGKHVKVVLSGEGSDEMFAGYPKHMAEAHLGRFGPSGVLSALGHGASFGARLLPRGKGRRLAIAARALRERRFEDRMVRWFGAITPEERARLWTAAVPEATGARSGVPLNAAPGASPLRRVLHFDQTSWLPDNLLERMDMMTMAASIEARTPFMDVKLAEFSATLPDSWRIQGRTTKRIVREALRPRIPDAVLGRPKNGFRMPVTEWFQGPLHDPFRDLLTGPDTIAGQYLDRAELDRYLSTHRSGAVNRDKTLWSLFALETFLREFF